MFEVNQTAEKKEARSNGGETDGDCKNNDD
jgi:hypothetical protein